MLSSSQGSWYRRTLPGVNPARAAGNAVIAMTALGAGVGIALGSKWGLAIAGISLLFAAASVGLFQLTIPRYAFGYMAIELPAIFILIASLGLRARTAEDLAANPLDFVGLLRLASTGIAFMLGAIACISATRDTTETVTNRPLRIYICYALVASIGIFASVSPALTGYRAFEVIAAIVMIAGAYRTAGKEALLRLEGLLYWWILILVGTVWVGVAAFPALTVQHINSPIPYQIQGVYPGVTSNTLGELAVLLIFWSVGRLLAPGVERGPRRPVAWAVAAFGFITLMGAQYRTGYAAVMLGFAILLFLRGRKVLAGFGVIVVAVGTIIGSRVATQAAPLLLRGQNSSQVSNLNGRLNWWELAIPIWKKSPIIGGGLRTASRLLVLGQSGFQNTSTVHSTWVEALVGTGVLGTAALAIFLMITMRRAFLTALRPYGRIVPLLALSTLAVRSFTGDTFESGGLYCLLTLVFVMGLRDQYFVRPRASTRISSSGHAERVPVGVD
ncbi:MAG: exopolysaccharide production protein ExoQ [Actinomycetota bacterium]|nr:exopolysaccharide production protein ExoQ [Actinomycetota bacterium]